MAGKSSRPPKRYCKHGHDTNEVGRLKSGGCAECGRKARREYARKKRTTNPASGPRRFCRQGHELEVVGRTAQGGCKKCNREAARRWYRKAKLERPTRVIDSRRQLQFGISRDDVQKLVDGQNGVCPICLNPVSPSDSLDHCHASGQVRGVLHNNCNCLLGFAADDPARLVRAIEYLQRSLEQ